MSAKLSRLRRQQYRSAIERFAQSDIGKTINKKMRLNKIIIIAQWAVIAALALVLIGVIVL